MRLCSIEGCGRKHYGRGWCRMHHRRWVVHGDPLVLLRHVARSPELIASAEERFWERVVQGSKPIVRPEMGPCRQWTGQILPNGYGHFSVEPGRKLLAHHYAWQLAGFDVPPGLQLEHLCHTVDLDYCDGGPTCPHRACVEVGHLALLSGRDNTLAGHGPAAVNARKTHCIHGHPFTPENTYVSPSGMRGCRTCRTARGRARRSE
jgi:hypothetical protein